MNALAVKCLAGLVTLIALVGGGYWWGDNAATNRDEAKALETERTAAQKLVAANNRVFASEHKAAQALADVSSTYQKGLNDVVSIHQDTINRIRAGTLRLSIPAYAVSANTDGKIVAGAGGRDGQARCELSDAAAEFLTGLASEADAVAKQLTAAQAVIDADRAAINNQDSQ